MKTNEPRLRDINKVADDLLYEGLLTPEGTQIQQVTEAPSISPHYRAELGESSFSLNILNFISHRSARTCRRSEAGSLELATEKVKDNNPSSSAI